MNTALPACRIFTNYFPFVQLFSGVPSSKRAGTSSWQLLSKITAETNTVESVLSQFLFVLTDRVQPFQMLHLLYVCQTVTSGYRHSVTNVRDSLCWLHFTQLISTHISFLCSFLPSFPVKILYADDTPYTLISFSVNVWITQTALHVLSSPPLFPAT